MFSELSCVNGIIAISQLFEWFLDTEVDRGVESYSTKKIIVIFKLNKRRIDLGIRYSLHL